MAFVALQDAFSGQQPAAAPQPASSFVPLEQAFNAAQTPSLPSQGQAVGAAAPPAPAPQPSAPQPAQQPGTLVQPRPQDPGGLNDFQVAGQANTLAQNAGRVADTLSPGITQNIGGSGFNLSDIGGPLGLASGLASKSPTGIAGGALGSLGTLSRVTNAFGTASPYVGYGLGAAGGGLGIYSGIKALQNGQVGTGVTQLLSGGASLYGAAAPVINSLFDTALPSLSSLAGEALTAVAPDLAAALGINAAADVAATGASAVAGGVVAVPLILDSIFSMMSGDETAGIMGGLMTGGLQDPYLHFATKLGENETQQGQGLQYLYQALPYAQSQQDLQNIIASYKKFVPGGNDGLKQFMGSDPWTIGVIPPEGSTTHGQKTTPQDWSGTGQKLQTMINGLRASLPTTGATPGASGVWDQIVNNEAAQKKINSGLNMGLQSQMSPENWAATTDSFDSPTQITAPISSVWSKFFPNYKPKQYTILPARKAKAPASGADTVAAARAQQYDPSVPATPTQIAQQYQGAPATQAQIQEQYQVAQAATPDGGGG